MYLQELYKKHFRWLKPEAKEQADLVLWLEANGYTYTAIPNSTWTTPKQTILNTMTWVSAWLCDMLVVLKRWSLLFVEMKLPRRVLKNWKLWASPSKVSNDQKKWISILNEIDNVEACIAYGYNEARDHILYFENLE